MRQTFKTLLFPILALLAIALPLLTSYEVREWAADTFLPSRVHNADPTPPFTPTVTTAPALRFIVVGDAGTGGRGQRQIAGSMARVAATDSTSLVLMLGDNFYERGVQSITDPQWLDKFETVYHHPSLQIPFFAVLGNHDYHGNPQAQVDYTATSGRWVMPSRFYSRLFSVDDSTDVDLFFLDTNILSDMGRAVRDSASYMPQLRWLESELKQSHARWKIVAGHHPVYSNGRHGNDPQLGQLLEPLLVRHNVDIYLAGHDHDLQILEPVQGVYHIVSGAGGKDRDVDWKDNTIFAATRLGFVRITVSHANVIVEFFDRDGVRTFSHAIPKSTLR